MGSKSKENLLVDEIENFIASNVRSRWIQRPKFKFFLRKANRVIGDKLVPTLDFASVEICESLRRKGIGTCLAEFCHFLNPFPVTYIENVLYPSWALRLNNLNKWRIDERSVNLEFMTWRTSTFTELGFETLFDTQKVPCGYVYPSGEVIPPIVSLFKLKGEDVFEYPYCRMSIERLKAIRKSQDYYDQLQFRQLKHEFRLRGFIGKLTK